MAISNFAGAPNTNDQQTQSKSNQLDTYKPSNPLNQTYNNIAKKKTNNTHVKHLCVPHLILKATWRQGLGGKDFWLLIIHLVMSNGLERCQLYFPACDQSCSSADIRIRVVRGHELSGQPYLTPQVYPIIIVSRSDVSSRSVFLKTLFDTNTRGWRQTVNLVNTGETCRA